MAGERQTEDYRDWLRRYDGGKWARHAQRSDQELIDAIERAKARIGRRRQSWHIVAAEMMDAEETDGE